MESESDNLLHVNDNLMHYIMILYACMYVAYLSCCIRYDIVSASFIYLFTPQPFFFPRGRYVGKPWESVKRSSDKLRSNEVGNLIRV